MGETVTYREAARRAIDHALTTDERVFIMGEDVGCYGGSYAVTKGLLAKHGPERVRDTPPSESGFTGLGIGAALGGMRPIVEIMTVNFSLLALDQIVNNAATLSHMSGGQFTVPVVIRMATGAGKQLAAQHSHSWEGWYAHIPGLKVFTPATANDAYGMILYALRQPDPILIFENATLYNTKGGLTESPETAARFAAEKASVVKPGHDVTLFTYGASLQKCLDAAKALEAEGTCCEVVDLRCLRPLDNDTIMASVAKTNRAMIVDEGWCSGGVSAEIGMRIMEQSFFQLDAPVARVCGEEVPIPYAKHMEEASIPQVPQIIAQVQKMLKQGEGARS